MKTEGLPLKSHHMNVLQGNVGTYVGTVINFSHHIGLGDRRSAMLSSVLLIGCDGDLRLQVRWVALAIGLASDLDRHGPAVPREPALNQTALKWSGNTA